MGMFPCSTHKIKEIPKELGLSCPLGACALEMWEPFPDAEEWLGDFNMPLATSVSMLNFNAPVALLRQLSQEPFCKLGQRNN